MVGPSSEVTLFLVTKINFTHNTMNMNDASFLRSIQLIVNLVDLSYH